MSLFLKTSAQEFRKKIIESIKYNYRKVYPQIKKAVRSLVVDEFNTAYFSHPTVRSLQTGDLKAEFGLQFAPVKVFQIYEAFVKSLQVNIGADKTNSVLNMRIEMARSDFQDALRLDAAYQTWTDSAGQTVVGEPLPWLEWLITEGDNLIISDYRFSTRVTGRSNLPGIMVPGAGWRVPSEHSGTLEHNFLTEVFDKVREGVDKKLWRTVRLVLTRDS